MTEQQSSSLDRQAFDLGLPTCISTLKPLARSGSYLAQISRVYWQHHGRGGEETLDAPKVPVRLVMELKRAGFISIGKTGRGKLSRAGRSWLNRQLGSGDPVVRQHQVRRLETFDEHSDSPRALLVNGCESPLLRLRNRKGRDGTSLLSDAEFEAGERLRRDFTIARLTPQVTAAWTGGAGAPGRRRKHGARTNHEQNLSDSAYAARARVSVALRAVGPEFENILLDTCCFLFGVEESETRYGWPRRSAKLVLKLALSALARHYSGEGSSKHRCLAAGAPEEARPAVL